MRGVEDLRSRGTFSLPLFLLLSYFEKSVRQHTWHQLVALPRLPGGHTDHSSCRIHLYKVLYETKNRK